MAKPPFGGHRTFTQFTPRRRAATEYELYTVGQQSSPEQWLHVGWPIRFDDGREPYTASSTAIRCGNWPDYRDPAAPPRPGPRLRGRPPDRPFVRAGRGLALALCTHAFERLEEEIELQPILEFLAARLPLDAALSEGTQVRLPLLFEGNSVALARAFKLIDAELKAVQAGEWERTFALFRLICAGLPGWRMCPPPLAGSVESIPTITIRPQEEPQWQRSLSAVAGGTSPSSTLPRAGGSDGSCGRH